MALIASVWVAGCSLAVEDRLEAPPRGAVEVVDAAAVDGGRGDARPVVRPPTDAAPPDASPPDASPPTPPAPTPPAPTPPWDPWAGWRDPRRACATDADCTGLQTCVAERCVRPGEQTCAELCAAVIPCLRACNALGTERDRAFQTGRCEAACLSLGVEQMEAVDCDAVPADVENFFCNSGMICTRVCGAGAEEDLLSCAGLPGNRCDLTCVTAPLGFWRCAGAASVERGLCDALRACGP
ncbi:MAG: hypothetical protein R3F43_17730 [bacterium]